MTPQYMDAFTCFYIPNTNGFVPRRRNDSLTVFTKEDGANAILMSFHRANALTSFNVSDV